MFLVLLLIFLILGLLALWVFSYVALAFGLCILPLLPEEVVADLIDEITKLFFSPFSD